MKNCFSRTARLLVTGFACHLVAGCSDSPTSGSATVGGSSAAPSIWQISSSTDPMNDAVVSEARALIRGASFDAEVTVQCHGGGDIVYTATAFDKEGRPAKMRPEVTSSGSVLFPFQFRVDNRPAISWNSFSPRYDNQITIATEAVQPEGPGGPWGRYAEDMAAGSNIVLRLFLLNGEETYQLSQTDPEFRSVIDPCVKGRQDLREQLTSASAAEELEASERHASSASELSGDAAASRPLPASGGYPSLRKGTNYTAARRTLVSAGFSPVKVTCEFSCPAFAESLGCSGTGVNVCRFVFVRDGQYSIVRTAGEDEDPGFDRIDPADSEEQQEIRRQR